MNQRVAGFSLVEMMVATVALMIMSMGIVGVIQSGTSAVRTNAASLDSYAKKSRTFQKLAGRLRGASLASLATIPEGFETPQPVVDGVEMTNLQFQSMQLVGGDETALPGLSPVQVLALQPSPTDPANGLDDNHNGLTDEQDLVLSQVGLNPIVLTTGVRQFGAVLLDGTLTLSVTLGIRQPDGNIRLEIDTRTWELRND